jgi:hypothetical protein
VPQKTSTDRPSPKLSIRLGQPYRMDVRIKAVTSQNRHWHAILDIPSIRLRILCRFTKAGQEKSAAVLRDDRAQFDLAMEKASDHRACLSALEL